MSHQLLFMDKQELRYVKSWSHGGSSIKKRRKIKRPLIPGKLTHVVLKATKAKGKLSFYAHALLIKSLSRELARKNFVKIHDLVNMGNHLHLKVSFKDSERFQNFLRSFAALLARQITGARKGKAFGVFWDGLAFTRVLHSKFEELGLKGYFESNHRERELGPTVRQEYLRGFNFFLSSLKSVRAAPVEPAELYLGLRN